MSDAGPETLDDPDSDEQLTPDFMREVIEALDAHDADRLKALVVPLHAADQGDLIELLKPDDRRRFVELMGDALDYEALAELDQSLRDELVAALQPEILIDAVKELDTDDALYLIEDLEEDAQEEILAKLPPPDRAALKRSLEYAEDSAGRLMQTDIVAVPPFWTVGQTIDYMRDEDDLPGDFYEIFVVDPTFHLLGTVPLSHLLRTRRPVRIEDLMNREPTVVPVDEDQEAVAYRFEQYNLVSAAVVDESERIVGVITIDDVVDVIHEEGEEDFRRLAGVGDEELTDTVWRTTRSRWTWLTVNLGTAILASIVIGLFDATIDQMVALAVLMPIVASMGGNAATQTMTVAVRALARRDLVTSNAVRIILRETLVGVLNGALFAVLLFAVAYVWFENLLLGGVIAAAIVVNMLFAALSGILVPIALDRLKIDPAIASSVFVTTVTDVVGFFAFLGLAAWWIL